MDDNEYKRPFIIVGIIVMLLIAVSVIWFLPDLLHSDDVDVTPSGSSQTPVLTTTPEPTTVPVLDPVHGLITSIDHNAKTFTVMNTDLGTDECYTYEGFTDVTTAYGKRISARLLGPGDFVIVTPDASGRAVTIKGSDRIWTYRNVFNLSIDSSIGKVSIGDHVFHYDDRLKVMLDDTFMTLNDLSSLDVFDVYGVDDHVFLISIACGHGFLTLANTADYIGGTLYINGDIYCQITEDLAPITLSEGDYTISVENRTLSGSADLRISGFETSVFDLAPYSKVPVSTGLVTFRITPRDAFLYIDGIRQSFTSPVSVTYGTHSIEVSLAGYETFKGTLSLDRSSMTYAVSLPLSDAGSGDDLYDDHGDETGDDDTSLYTMTVYCDEGCSVYANGAYRGKIKNGSLSFTRPNTEIITISFELSGYETATYAITVEEDDHDMDISFPEMTPSAN